jgi:hypothetical protein
MIMVMALRLILERLRLGGRVGNRQSSVEESYDAFVDEGLRRGDGRTNQTLPVTFR